MAASTSFIVIVIGFLSLATMESMALSLETDADVSENLPRSEEDFSSILSLDAATDMLGNVTDLDDGFDLGRRKSVCQEIKTIVLQEAFNGGGNKNVLKNIMHELKYKIRHRVGGYFVVVYNDVSGSSRHWGHSMCGNFFRQNGYNIRVLFKRCSGRRCGGRVGKIKICWGCGVWYNDYGMEVDYYREGNMNRFNVYL